jgi:hypothetical protein
MTCVVPVRRKAAMASNTENVTGGGQANAPAKTQQDSAQSGQIGRIGKPLEKDEAAVEKFVRSPATIGTITGAVVLGTAVIWGALEAAIGAGAAYVAYRALRKVKSHG